MFFFGVFFAVGMLIPSVGNTCTQSSQKCQREKGVHLICKGPNAGSCFAGGCSTPVIPVLCRDEL